MVSPVRGCPAPGRWFPHGARFRNWARGGFGHSIRPVTEESPASYRRYCLLLAGGGLVATLALLAVDGLRVDETLGVVLLGAVITAALGTVADSGRTALSLQHLPSLAAAYVCAGPVAPIVGATLAAIDNRRFGRWVALANAGTLALSVRPPSAPCAAARPCGADPAPAAGPGSSPVPPAPWRSWP